VSGVASQRQGVLRVGDMCRGMSDGPIDTQALDQLSADMAADMQSHYNPQDGE
jgi:hypothetical protein